MVFIFIDTSHSSTNAKKQSLTILCFLIFNIVFVFLAPQQMYG